ncbi:MAG: LAGLIDADG family homing endonuclease [Candidatus Aenigmatarchaeota archaeon]
MDAIKTRTSENSEQHLEASAARLAETSPQLKKPLVTENQLKVIKDKYLRDDPSVDIWLWRVAENIALSELLYDSLVPREDILAGVSHRLEKVEAGDARGSERLLLHAGIDDHNTRLANHRRFIANLYKLAREHPHAKAVVREQALHFYELMAAWDFLPNSPCLMNAGRALQQLSACYVLPIEDSIEGWGDTVKNTMIIHQCLVPETLVMTDAGLAELGTVTDNHHILTHLGPRQVSATYRNGRQPIFKVTTEHGYGLTGTAEHKLLVINETGLPAWRPISELRPSDWLMLSTGGWHGGVRELPPFEWKPKAGRNRTSFKARDIRLPTEMSEEFAELIGLYIGDGSNHRDGIRFSIGFDDADLVARITELSKKMFGVDPVVSKKRDGRCYEVALLSVKLKAWMAAIGVTKSSANDASIPGIVRRADEPVICAFLRGLFSADGCVRQKGYITLATVSHKLLDQAQVALLHLGIPTRNLRLSTGVWQLNVCSRRGFELFREKIGFMAARKQGRLLAVDSSKIFTRREYLPRQIERLREWYDGLPKHVKADIRTNHLLEFQYQGRELTVQKLQLLADTYPAEAVDWFGELLDGRFFYSRVRAVEPAGKADVIDLTVPGIHAYLANGFISHNSGGGTGFSAGRVRHRGDTVKSTAGIASGALSPFILINQATGLVKQGGTRRGANMGILPWWHPDIVEFIDSKQEEGKLENFNISVALDARFMTAAENDEEVDLVSPRTKQPVRKIRAKDLFDKIINNAWRTGDPGVIFMDRINDSLSNPTPALGEIESTNPCVAGDTLVYTGSGLMTAGELAANPIPMSLGITVDGRMSPDAMLPASNVFWTGRKPVYRLVTQEGYSIRLTGNHRVMTDRGWVEARDLMPGDRIHILSRKGGFGTKGDLDTGRIAGHESMETISDDIIAASEDFQRGFLQVLFTDCGQIDENGIHLRKTNVIHERIQQMLLNFGIYSIVNKDELHIRTEQTKDFHREIGFLKDSLIDRLEVCLANGAHVTSREHFTVSFIELKSEGEEDVFDLSEPRTHSFVANGFVVHNCGEQPLLPFESCNLGSINLRNFTSGNDFDWPRLRSAMRTAVRFMDNCIDVNNLPLEEIESITKGNRRLGIGVMGWAESLSAMGIPYDSEAALSKAEQTAKFLEDVALAASEELAAERGVFPNFVGSMYDPSSPYRKDWAVGRPRNCARTTIAPTGTIAITAGLQGGGIEPFFALVYTRYNAKALDALKKGEKPEEGDVFYEVNPVFRKVADSNAFWGMSEADLWKRIVENHGSVRGIEEIPEAIQRAFATAHDIGVPWHVRMQAAWQKFTDNAVSKTINMPNSATPEEVRATYLLAWKTGCKGITVYRDGCKSQQVLNLSAKKLEPKIEMMEPQVRPRPRPKMMEGKTQEVRTGCGDMYITVNRDEKGPFELFAAIGKSGGCISSYSEAVARLVSLALRSGVDPKQVVKQLKGIRCSRPVFDTGGVTYSCADCIAKAFEKVIAGDTSQQAHLAVFAEEAIPQHKEENGKNMTLDGRAITPVQEPNQMEQLIKAGARPECPECGGPVNFVEGCVTCSACGYSACG